MNDNSFSTKPWSGRFTETTDAFIEHFTASVTFDKRLYDHDINGSLAHANMLNKVGILGEQDYRAIEAGLEAIRNDIKTGQFNWSIGLEDVHMNIEAQLIERIGDAGKKLHTGRSRNDQVATTVRLYLRDAIDTIATLMTALQTALIDQAEQHTDTIMPGFTHLQTAQPVTFGHHMLAWNAMLERDYSRLMDCRKRLNQCPLGAGALAGTSYPIDRAYTAQLLGFDAPTDNALDSVSDRDFAIELTAFASLLMTHLSRFSEELIIWMSAPFQFVSLPDRFCTGSSMMPQKKNPDVPELVRGKTGRVNGHLISLLTLMKAQPLAYNKDNQEDKEPLFDTIDTVCDCLKAYADMVPTITANNVAMLTEARRGYATATDLADYLVNKGLPFRDAHEVVGQAVAHGLTEHKDLSEMALEELQKFSKLIDKDVFNVLTLQGSVNARNHIGGTAPEQVAKAAQQARATLQER